MPACWIDVKFVLNYAAAAKGYTRTMAFSALVQCYISVLERCPVCSGEGRMLKNAFYLPSL